MVKNPPAEQEIWVWFLDPEDPLEKEPAIHSSILAWRTLNQRVTKELWKVLVTSITSINHGKVIFHEQRSLAGYSLWSHESWTWLSFNSNSMNLTGERKYKVKCTGLLTVYLCFLRNVCFSLCIFLFSKQIMGLSFLSHPTRCWDLSYKPLTS